MLLGGEETEHPIEAPALISPSVDYGENVDRVETEVTNNHRYIYVEGNANLPYLLKLIRHFDFRHPQFSL